MNVKGCYPFYRVVLLWVEIRSESELKQFIGFKPDSH
jgi:hypothetical protein